MNYREKIRKAIECPQLNNTRYGEWGTLTLEQRKYIKRLLDELDNADNFVKKLYFENKQLKEQLLVNQTNEETFRLEMEDITKTLGLDEDTIFDDVKAYVRILKDNWNELKEYIRKNIIYDDVGMKILDPSPLEDYMQELEQGSDK